MTSLIERLRNTYMVYIRQGSETVCDDRLTEEAAAAIESLTAANKALRELADAVLFHQLCCLGGCHQSMKAMAKLARAIDWEADPATMEELAEAEAANDSSHPDEETWGKTHECFVEERQSVKASNKALRELLGKAVMALTEAQPHLPSGTDAEEFCSTMIGEIAQALSAGLTKGEK